MITKFKIFESNEIPTDEYDLVEMFSQKQVEDYFDQNYQISADEASKGVNIWNYVDDDEVRKFFIDEIVKQEIKNGSETEQDLRIYYEEKWDSMLPSEILEEIWGKGARYDAYDYISHLVDKLEMLRDYRNMIDYEVKNDFIRDSIATDFDLQDFLFTKNKNTVTALFDVMDNKDHSLGKTYNFQKEYIKQGVELENPEDSEEITANQLRDLNDKFELDPRIRKEYSDYLYLIDAEKYNL